MVKAAVALLRRHAGLALALALFWEATGLSLVLALWGSGGRLVYALDDPYIHMAIARRFSQSGVWGINAGEFASASSSPLWTLLLAAVYRVAGVNEVAPFALNLIIATVLCVVVSAILSREGVRPALQAVLLTALWFVLPLPLLVFLGQEHTLHTLLAVAFTFTAGRVLAAPAPRAGHVAAMCVLGALVTGVRYEGVLMVVPTVVLLALTTRRMTVPALVTVAALTPPVLYGLWSVSQGWSWLPHSVLVRGGDVAPWSLAGALRFGYRWYQETAGNPAILISALGLLGGLLLSLRSQEPRLTAHGYMALIALATLFLHMQFAKTGWLYRYEAYLIALAAVVTALPVNRFLTTRAWKFRPMGRAQRVAFGVLCAVALSPLLMRGATALMGITQATTDIYRQQYQMGLFLRDFYQGASIAAHDIGAVSFLADIHCIDLVGLASREIGEARIGRASTAAAAQRVLDERQTAVAVVFDHWFSEDERSRLVAGWTLVGQWSKPVNYVSGGASVSWYAVRPEEVAPLAANLRAFAPRLPPDIMQRGMYVEARPQR